MTSLFSTSTNLRKSDDNNYETKKQELSYDRIWIGTMIRCDYCGNLNYYGNAFCTDCGSSLRNENYVPPPPQVWKLSDENLLLPKVEKPNKTQKNFVPPQLTSHTSQQFSQTHQESNSPSTYRPFHVHQHSHFLASQQVLNPSVSSSVFQPSSYCWVCQKSVFPLVYKKISTAGWIVFAILLVLFFPLFWIGFLIKEEVHYCPHCYTQIR